MMTKRGIDISSFQDSSLPFLKTMKSHGAKYAIVKLTEGTTYLNGKASAQISNGLKTFDSVGAYHFFHGEGTAEARYFLAWVKHFGLDKSTVLAIDVEYQGLPSNATPQINVFLNYLKSHGYKNVITYGSRSWFTYGRIKRGSLTDKATWVAAYGTDRPGIDHADAWQDTDNWHGVDGDLDFTGKLSGSTTPSKPKKVTYWHDNGLYEVIASHVNVYGKVALDKPHRRRMHFTKGSTIYGKAVKYKNTYRIKTDSGFITANKDKVKLIRKSK